MGRGLAAPVTRSSSSAVTSPSVWEDHLQSLPSSAYRVPLLRLPPMRSTTKG